MMTGPMPEGPQPGQHYPGQPQPGQQYPGQQVPGQQGQSGPGGPGRPPGRNRVILIVCLVIAAVAVLLVILAVVVFAIVIGASKDDGGKSAEPSTPEEQVTALAQDYMDSLEAGDPAPALELIAHQERHGAVVLDEEQYAKALEESPITDVVVGTPTMSAMSGEVVVDYTVGDERTTSTISANDYDDDGTYELTVGLEHSQNVPASLTGLAPTLNGQEVEPEEQVMLLPGTYEFAIDHELFDLDGATSFTDVSSESRVDWPDVELSDDGQKQFRKAVQSSVDSCVKEKTLKAGCGMGDLSDASTDGWTIKDDTVSRSIPESTQRTIEKMEATPGSDEPTYVTGSRVGTVDTKVECTKGGQKGTCELILGGGMGIPSVDLADDEHPVTWE
jgi:hypothetical protein